MKTQSRTVLVALIAVMAIGALILPGCLFDSLTPTPEPDPIHIAVDPPSDNAQPIAFEPLVLGSGQWREVTPIDLRHRLHGCNSTGGPLWQTGAYDPDGDSLEYFIKVTGPDDKGGWCAYSVFDKRGNRVDGRWIPADHFDTIPVNAFDSSLGSEPDVLVYCFIGHDGDATPIQENVLSGMGCTPNPLTTTADPRLEELGVMRVTYLVRDPEDARAVGFFARRILGQTCPD